MRIAIPKWRNRISPLFDASSMLFIVDVDNGKLSNMMDVEFESKSEQDRIQSLVDNKVDVLICGGISRLMEDMVLTKGIRLISGVKGSVHRIVDVFIEGGRFDEPSFRMPGCRRRKGFQTGCGGRGRRRRQPRDDG